MRSDIETLRTIASLAFADAVEICAIIEVLETGNQKPVIKKIVRAGAGRAANIIQRSLFSRMQLIVARAYSEPRKGDRHLRMAFNLLSDANLSDLAANHYGSSDELIQAREIWEACNADPALGPFLVVRHKRLAHLAELDPAQTLPLIREAFAIAKNTARAMELLAQGVGVVSLSLESQVISHKESAARFWRQWEPKRRQRKQRASASNGS